jgi:hypothetical protein
MPWIKFNTTTKKDVIIIDSKMNNNDVNSKLIDAFKNAKKLISQDPNNKQNIIRDYIDLVLKLNNYSSNNNENSSSDINIYNNFNTIPNDLMNGYDNIMNNTNSMNRMNRNNNNYIDITKTSTNSIQELASAFNYINK